MKKYNVRIGYNKEFRYIIFNAKALSKKILIKNQKNNLTIIQTKDEISATVYTKMIQEIRRLNTSLNIEIDNISTVAFKGQTVISNSYKHLKKDKIIKLFNTADFLTDQIILQTSYIEYIENIDKSFKNYFKISEQVDTILSNNLEINNNKVISATYVLIQKLPGISSNFEKIKKIIEKKEYDKLFKGLKNKEERKLIIYRCNCNQKKADRMNIILNDDKIHEIICQKCGKKYEIN